MSDDAIYIIKLTSFALMIWAGLAISMWIGPQTAVLLGAVALLCVFGSMEVLAMLALIFKGVGYSFDTSSVIAYIAAGYVVINYLI